MKESKEFCPHYLKYCPHSWVLVETKGGLFCGIQKGDNNVKDMKHCATLDYKNYPVKKPKARNKAKERKELWLSQKKSG